MIIGVGNYTARAVGRSMLQFVLTGRFVSRHERESLMSHLLSVSPADRRTSTRTLRIRHRRIEKRLTGADPF
jgi:hypothetical protein